MNDKTTAPATVKAVADSFEATLVRGSSYTLRGKIFRKGEPVTVTAPVKEYLEQNAYEEIRTGSGDDEEIERKPKFKFARSRTRA